MDGNRKARSESNTFGSVLFINSSVYLRTAQGRGSQEEFINQGLYSVNGTSKYTLSWNNSACAKLWMLPSDLIPEVLLAAVTQELLKVPAFCFLGCLQHMCTTRQRPSYYPRVQETSCAYNDAKIC